MFYLSLDKTAEKRQQSAATIEQLEREVAIDRAKLEQLEQQASAAATDFAKEKIIRDDLLMKEPGEIVVQLPDIELTEPKKEVESDQKTPLEEWKVLIFGE